MKVFERKARGEKRWSNSPLTVLEVGQLSKTEVDRGTESTQKHLNGGGTNTETHIHTHGTLTDNIFEDKVAQSRSQLEESVGPRVGAARPSTSCPRSSISRLGLGEGGGR